MIRRLALFMAAVVLGIVLVPSQSAQAASTFELWRFRDGTICLRDHGWKRWPFEQVVAEWNKAENVSIIRDDDCAGFPRSMVIYVTTYSNPNENACAKTGSWNNRYTWTYVDGEWTWVPEYMTIWFNMAENLYQVCNGTLGARQHLASHEIGHALGLAHPVPVASVMYSWSYNLPTDRDKTQVAIHYQGG